MIANLDALKYLAVVQPLIECLKPSILKKALVHHEYIALSTSVLVFLTPSYNKSLDVMSFETEGHKSAISKVNLYKFLGLPVRDAWNPELVLFANMLRVLKHMGYSPVLNILSRFRNSCLPAIWDVICIKIFQVFF